MEQVSIPWLWSSLSMLLARSSSLHLHHKTFSFSASVTLCRLSAISPAQAFVRVLLRRAAAVACCRVASSRSLCIFWNFGLPLLVHLNLGGSGPAGAASSRSLISSSSGEVTALLLCFEREARSASRLLLQLLVRAWRWGLIVSSFKLIGNSVPGWMRLTETMDLPVTHTDLLLQLHLSYVPNVILLWIAHFKLLPVRRAAC